MKTAKTQDHGGGLRLTFDCLSKKEVRERYNRAENKNKELRILCELTDSTAKEMRAFLGIQTSAKSAKRTTNPTIHQGNAKKTSAVFDKNLAFDLYENGYMVTAIAKACGVSDSTIYKWIEDEQLPSPRIARMNALHSKLMILYKRGMTDKQMAKEAGCTPRTVKNWRKNNDLPSYFDLCRMKKLSKEKEEK